MNLDNNSLKYSLIGNLNPIEFTKDTLKSGLVATLYHVASFTMLDPFTSLSAGISTYTGNKLGKNQDLLSEYEKLKECDETLNENLQLEVSNRLKDLKKEVHGISGTMNRNTLGLIGIISYDVSQAETLNQALATGMVDIGIAFGTGFASLLISAYKNNQGPFKEDR